MAKEGKYAEAGKLLLELKKATADDPFQYQEDLAFALYNGGKRQAAKQAFREIIDGSRYSAQRKKGAQRQLDLIEAVQADILGAQGDYAAAKKILLTLKGRFRGRSFPFQEQLAFLHLDAGYPTEAHEAFQELVSNPVYEEHRRERARNELNEIKVNDLVEKGYAALEGRVNWTRSDRWMHYS